MRILLWIYNPWGFTMHFYSSIPKYPVHIWILMPITHYLIRFGTRFSGAWENHTRTQFLMGYLYRRRSVFLRFCKRTTTWSPPRPNANRCYLEQILALHHNPSLLEYHPHMRTPYLRLVGHGWAVVQWTRSIISNFVFSSLWKDIFI